MVPVPPFLPVDVRGSEIGIRGNRPESEVRYTYAVGSLDLTHQGRYRSPNHVDRLHIGKWHIPHLGRVRGVDVIAYEGFADHGSRRVYIGVEEPGHPADLTHPEVVIEPLPALDIRTDGSLGASERPMLGPVPRAPCAISRSRCGEGQVDLQGLAIH